MILSVSGKIKSGKDECAKIVQYLTTDNTNDSQIINYHDHALSIYESSWKVKKWAYAVKQVCSLLLNIPVEDFEKEEVKDRVLGKEWNQPAYYRAEYDSPEPIFLTRYLKFPTVEAILTDFDYECDRICTYDHYYEKLQNLKETYNSCYVELGQYNITYIPEQPITIRWLLQNVGTNAMRDVIHQNVWVNCLMNQYTCDEDMDYPSWIITDTRFPNEASAVKEKNGINIRINRSLKNRFPDLWQNFCDSSDNDYYISEENFMSWLYETHFDIYKKLTHSSETSLDTDYVFDEVIENNGSLEDLIEQIKLILIKYKIL